MISRLSYVHCDRCGNPAEVADNAEEARVIARGQGFIQIDGKDVCWRCNPDSGRCVTCGIRPENWLVGCNARDGIHTAPGAPAEEKR